MERHFPKEKMVKDSYSSRTYVWIRRIVLVAIGVASSICWNNYSSRTCVRIRRMVLVSLCGVTDLFNIMPQLLKWSMASRDDAIK